MRFFFNRRIAAIPFKKFQYILYLDILKFNLSSEQNTQLIQ